MSQGAQQRLDYIVDLGRRHYDEIGFIPRPSLEKANQLGLIDYEVENGDLCGYLLWGNGWPVMRIYQACIQYDAQRIRHGYELVKRLIIRASDGGFESICLWCADDLPSNNFWESCGFARTAQRNGGMKRGRKHNLWVFRMPNPKQLLLEIANS